MNTERKSNRKRPPRFLLVLSAIGWVLLLTACRKQSVTVEELAESTASLTVKTAAVKTVVWYVQISGAVAKPGVYEMVPDSRVFQLIEAAGGFTETAATEQINRALRLQDGQHIHVPTIEETEKQATARAGTAASGDTAAASGKVDINRAGTEELCTLPGIGPSKAADIIAYRTKLGGFTDPAQLMEIAGIKEGLFEKIKDHIMIQ